MTKRAIKPGLIGKKIGMTQFFNESGDAIGVTVIQVGPCTVTQVKTQAGEGYDAVQLGFSEVEFRKMNKPSRNKFEKKGINAFRHLKEFRVEAIEQYQVGQVISAEAFQVGERVDIAGRSKGKGFQGVIKRHHKAGGPASHGSTFHRSTGSIGQRTWPGRVFKLMKLPGHMGDENVTVQNLKIVGIVPEKNYILIEGAVPGSKNKIVYIKSRNVAEFEKRISKKAEEPAIPAAE